MNDAMAGGAAFLMAATFVLLPYQQSWVKDESRVRVVEKSRRIGLSWTEAAEAVLDAGAQDGCDVWYVGYNKDMSEEFIRDCADWARSLNVYVTNVEEALFDDDDPEKQILTYTIRFATGYRITALSSRPTNLRGKKGRIIIDEAAFHDNLPGLLKSAMAVLMWGGRARVDIISTHNGNDSHFNKIVEEVRAKKRGYSLHRITLDDALKQGLYRRICLINGDAWTAEGEAQWRADLYKAYGEDAEEELDCVPTLSGGIYIQRDAIEAVMKPGTVARLTVPDGFLHWKEELQRGHIDEWCKSNLLPLLTALPKDKQHFFGEDFGRTRDRTVICPGYIAQDLKRVVPFAIEMLDVPYETQKQVLFYMVDRLPRFAKGALDATGNGGFLAEAALSKYGASRIECITLSEQWYAEHLPQLRAAIHEKKVQFVADADHLLDLTQFKTINGLPKLPKVRTSTKKNDGPPRHGDAGVAYLLANYAAGLPKISHGESFASAPKPMSGFASRKGVF